MTVVGDVTESLRLRFGIGARFSVFQILAAEGIACPVFSIHLGE